MIHYTCIYLSGLGAFAAWARVRRPRGVPSHNALVHFGECANPFWRMRLSILSNAPIYFGKCIEQLAKVMLEIRG